MTTIAEMRDQYDMRRRLIVDGLNRLGLTCFEPEGAFYVFRPFSPPGMTSDEFCERLIYDKHVAVGAGLGIRCVRRGLWYAFRMRIPSSTLQRR